MLRSLPAVFAIVILAQAHADISIDYSYGEGMVLQHGVKAHINGTAKQNEQVTLTFREKSYKAVADKIWGTWEFEFETGEAGGPFSLIISGTNTIELKNILVSEMTLGPILGEGMVLQRGSKAPIFGTANPGDKISVTFRDKTAQGVADEIGSWRINVDLGEAGGPFSMTIQGKTKIDLKEVYVGEVWVCSGQSNMRYALSYSKDAAKLVLEPPNSRLRLQRCLDASYAPNHPPEKYSGWQAANKKTAMEFSGTAYYFGAMLQEKLKIPIGLIDASVNATVISEWTPGAKLVEIKGGSAGDGQLYRRKIKPIQPFAIRGVIWYQGESNAQGKDPYGLSYDRRLAALIESWRKDWGQDDFPFLFVQLSRIGFVPEQIHGDKLPNAEQRDIVKDWARVRDEQRKVLSMLPSTAMAVSFDVTTGNLHPPEKKAIGERLALAARAVVYGEKTEYAGPLIESAKIENNRIVLTFSHADGLTAHDGELRQFEIQTKGEEKFTQAKAQIVGTKVILDASGTTAPLAVRYGYREWPDGNLYNSADLPASPFSITDIK